MMQELTPPEALNAPEPVQVVPANTADSMVKLKPAAIAALDERVDDFVGDVLNLDLSSDAFQKRLAAVHELGNAEARQAASVSSRFLERPLNAANGLQDNQSPVGRNLLQLRKTIEDLDPTAQGDLFAPKKLFGLIPFGDKLRDYFLRYESAQGHLNTVIEGLYRSQDELRRDNAAIEQEKLNLWNAMQALQSYVYIGKQIDTRLDNRVAELQAKDPDKARVVRDEMLFAVRQKVQDLLTQLAVSIQGYLALDMVRKNNLELIKGVDRATTTTVTALRTAVIVAQALANQKLVLDQINALNATTSNLIEATSKMLGQQSDAIAKQSVNTTVNIESLKSAFANIYGAMDNMSNYKAAALDSMKQTVTVLEGEIKKANSYLDRAQAGTLSQETAQIGGYKL
jgi:uncharacterized protein YaaN involved in tellurite resistance